ncbi:hypothetical protein ATE84_0720 [Aquimarina sp. MAR_2010_214]|uniref:hypothetical protein n=1 Tax=Aquimarina sp. MAR_2010_214 TaxID=1250026 RepID=UPI000C70523D|nr:hypothetical protein [Aquimarina sp. MAR_2010_214]PKV48714.1 hypothetical protein ATE84_0720 [Aquimarina sp. MAR_2010_214]
MKKLMYVAVFIFALGFTACGSDDANPIDCLANAGTLTTAAANYGTDQSTENCNAYKAALESYLNNNCFADQATEDSSRATLAELNCNV